LAVARTLAVSLRGPGVRALGLPFGTGAQVSMNLLNPRGSTLTAVYDAVAAGAEAARCPLVRAELVGLVPAAVLDDIPRHRWAELDLDPARTIEARLAERRPHPPIG
jgi:glutamate formiminotransferase